MNTISINGQELDMPEGFSVELVKKNILFAFDDIECERTTSFDIPATPKNQRIFALAGVVAGDGAKMRTRLSAELRAGMVAQAGYLYLSTYDVEARSYSAAFVTGELLPLIDIRNAGKLSEYLVGNFGAMTLTNTILLTPFIAYQEKLAPINYHDTNTEREYYRPSMQVKMLIDACAAYFGCNVTYPAHAYDWQSYRILLDGSYNKVGTLTGCILRSVCPTTVTTQWINEIDTAAACPNGSIFTAETIELKRKFAGTTDIYKVKAYKANQHVSLTFAANVPASWVLIDNSVQQQYAGYVIASNLAGSTVDIPYGTVFALIDPTQQWASPNAGYTEPAFNTSATFTLTGIDNPTLGDIIRGVDNLPDLTFIELLKMVAALTGLVLTYDGTTNTFSFDSLSGSGMVSRSVDTITKRGTVERRFSDYQQANLVRFDSAEEVTDGEKIIVNYPITNVNLDKQKELLVIPLSEGRKWAANDNSVTVGAKSAPTLCRCDTDITGSYYMQRVTLGQNQVITGLCSDSTAYELECVMSALEFATLTPKTLIEAENLTFWWTEARWNAGVCSLKLSKISQ